MHETNLRRRNRIFKILRHPLTYLGVERTVFSFVCVGAASVFNLFASLLAGLVVFIDGSIFGRWVTTSDPAMLRGFDQSERFRILYDAAKQERPLVEVRQMLRPDRVVRPGKESGALNSKTNLYGFWGEQSFLTKSGDLGIVLRVHGVDYESLDQAAREYAVKGSERF
jgi:type IV secretory pathway TrbD component